MKSIFRNVVLVVLFLPFVLSAQRPQGLGADFVDAVLVGSDVVAVSNLGGTGADGQIRRSMDKGDSFTVLYTVPTSGDEIYTIAANGNVVIASGRDSVFYRAADYSGNPTTWTKINAPSATFGDAVDLAANGSTWIAVGGEILRSTNNGLSWAIVSPGGMDTMQAVTYNSLDNSWLVVGGSGGGSAWRSTNDGVSWTEISLPPSTFALKGIATDGFGNVIAVGETGTVLELAANGLSFSVADLGTFSLTQNLQAVVATGDGEWLLGGDERSLVELTSTGATQILEATPGDAYELVLLDDAVLMAGIETVPAPVISPSSTTSFVPLLITLVEDPGVDGTYYTTDGSSPDKTKTLYSTSFTLSENGTVKAVSEKDGVYSALVSETFTITIHTLSISPNGTDIDLTLDTSVNGYNYQLKSKTDLTDPAAWSDEGSPKSGTGDPLDWTLTAPASPHFWKVEILSP